MADDQGVPVRAARDRAISIVAAVLVAVGLVLTPVAVVAAQARPLLTDTDRFVATFGPLAGERAVQDAVADAAMAGIDSRVDFSALAATALGNVGGQLSLPPAVVTALQALGDRAAGALRAVVDDQVRALVSSDGFATVWRQMLRTAHAQALAGLRDDPYAGLVIRGDTLVLQVGPVVDRTRQALLDRGYRVAALLPSVDRTVELVDVEPATVGAAAFAAGLELHELSRLDAGLEALFFRLVADADPQAPAGPPGAAGGPFVGPASGPVTTDARGGVN